jgi:hypothetical protein
VAHDLPESDLLKALHCYASDFYSRTHGDVVDWRSMDETALITLGIVMEEVSHLGHTADLALTEGQSIDDGWLPQRSGDRAAHARLGSDKRLVKRRRINDSSNRNSSSSTEAYES